MRRFHYLLFLAIFFIAGCDKENNLPKSEPTQVVFTSKIIGNRILTDKISDQWKQGDQIGVFVEGNNNYKNVLYFTSGTGFFRSDVPIFYPNDNTSYNFIAYYPYNADIKDDKYPIDLMQEQTNLLYSNNLKNVRYQNVDFKNLLEFNHVLPYIYLRIVPSAEVNSLEGLSVQVEEYTKATFSILNGKLTIDQNSRNTIPLAVSGDNSEKTSAGVLMPASLNTATLNLTIGAQTYKWIIPNTIKDTYFCGYEVKLNQNSIEVTTSFDSQSTGKIYTLSPINATNPTPDTVPSVPTLKSYMEIPVVATSGTAQNGYQVTHMVTNMNWLNNSNSTGEVRNYTVHFNIKERYPEWVAYPLHPTYMTSGNRTDDWQYDPLVPQQYQPNLFSGWQGRGFSRGHMLPSASRSATKELNRTTFYFTNMAAQENEMNSSTWNDLEEKVRYWSKQTTYDTLYVVTGAILPASPEPITYVLDISGEKSAIPKYLYKALLRKNKSTGTYYSIAFKMENRNTGITYTSSVVSVEQIEQETGFTFFPKLPENVGNAVKRQKDLANWN
ncbi:MAG: DNA/RNA non-specific endonuclease [Proteiniphilum sp.]